MAIYANQERDKNSKKSKAEQQFFESFSNLGDDLGYGIEDIQNPDFGYEAFDQPEDVTRVSRVLGNDEDYGIGDVSNINTDGSNVPQDAPRNAQSFLNNRGPSVEEILLNQVAAPEKPVKDTKTQDQLKKYATARGVGELVKALSDTWNLTRGGINAQGTQGDIPMVLNQIMQIDQNHLQEMQQYRDDLLRRDLFNAGVANDQALFNARMREAEKDRSFKGSEAEKARKARENEFRTGIEMEIARLENSNNQADINRAHEWKMLLARLSDNEDQRKYGRTSQQQNQLKLQLEDIENRRDSILSQIDEEMAKFEDERDVVKLKNLRYQLGELKVENEAFSQKLRELNQVDYSRPEVVQAPYAPGTPASEQAIVDSFTQRPPVSPGATQVDTATSDQKVETKKEEPKKEVNPELKAQVDSMVGEAVRQGEVTRAQMYQIKRAFEDAEMDVSDDWLKEYLENKGVKITFSELDLLNDVSEDIRYPLGRPNNSQISQR